MNNEPVGTLEKLSNGALSFAYDPAWISSPGAVPLSLSLPLSTKTYSGDVVINHFDNLLPDNDGIRKAISQRMSLHSQEAFDLLAAIGRDCVGAIQLIPSDEKLVSSIQVQARPITDAKIAEVLKNLKSYPLGVKSGGDFRISIAGAQEKTAFLKIGNRWHVPIGTTPSTHIFKVQMGMLRNVVDMSRSVENEWLCLQICKAFKLPTANAEVSDFDGVRTLVVERFDRGFEGKRILRYAQEDFCQVFGISSHKKYENEGGPGIPQIMSTLSKSDDPTQDRTVFMKSQVVFWLLAAIDGHAKNFSVFLAPGGLRLTPLYDVMSAHPPIAAKQIPHQKAKLAMAIGDNRHYRIKEIARRHWLQTAKHTRFGETRMNEVIDKVIEQTPEVVSAVSRILPKNFPDSVSGPILEGLRKSAQRLGGGGGP